MVSNEGAAMCEGRKQEQAGKPIFPACFVSCLLDLIISVVFYKIEFRGNLFLVYCLAQIESFALG